MGVGAPRVLIGRARFVAKVQHVNRAIRGSSYDPTVISAPVGVAQNSLSTPPNYPPYTSPTAFEIEHFDVTQPLRPDYLRTPLSIRRRANALDRPNQAA